MGERNIEDIMRDVKKLINEAASNGYKIGEIKSHFIDRSDSENKKYETNEVLYQIVE